jgi:transposase-like protein
MGIIKKPTVRKIYHEAFRLKMIELVESGEYSIAELNRIYEIGGKNTIRLWLRQYGKESLIGTRELIMKADEVSTVQKLREQNKDLQISLKDITIDYLCQKAVLETAFSLLTEEQKKSVIMNLSPEQLKQLKRMGIKYL